MHPRILANTSPRNGQRSSWPCGTGSTAPLRPESCPSPSWPQTSHGSTRWLSRASRFRISTEGRRSNFSAWWTWRWRVGRCDPACDDKCTGGTSPNPPPQYQEDDDSIDEADWRPALSNECVRRDRERTHSPGKTPEVDHVTP